MKTFSLHLYDTSGFEHINNVISFVAEDNSGSFGLQANHARFMTSLIFGLARYRLNDSDHKGGLWQYLALPGGILYFDNNSLFINTRRYLRDDNFERISLALQERLLSEEQQLDSMKGNIRHMEEELLKRMWQLGRRK